MADLTYNSGDLSVLGDQLADITTRLKDDGRLKSYDRADVAHRKVADAIDDFVNDWDDKRKKLTEKVEALSEMAKKSDEEFTKADRELAESRKSEEG
jgi:hypothetical protein